MKTIAHAPMTLPLKTAALNVDVQATLTRRVLPLGLALGAWALLIGGLRLTVNGDIQVLLA